MYKASKYIGEGATGCVLSLVNYKHLCVKILFEKIHHPYRKLHSEMEKGKMFRKLELPVLRYVKIVKVKIETEDARVLSLFPSADSKIYYGLVMELASNDLKMVDKLQVHLLYERNATKFKQLGIEVIDSAPTKNVLYSHRHNNLYFADFYFWMVPLFSEMKKRKKLLK